MVVLGHPKRFDIMRGLPFVKDAGSITKRRALWRGWFGGRSFDYAFVYGFDEPLVRYALRVADRVVAFRQKGAELNRRLYRCVDLPPFQSEHSVLHCLRLPAALGISAAGLRLAYQVTPQEALAARARLSADIPRTALPLIGFQVASFPTKGYRDWPIPNFAELAERAVQTISATGREALAEMRRLLGVLRGEDGGGERTPQPGTQSLAELAERVRAVGLPVRLDIVGNVDDLPAGVGLGIYRIVQEALTNSIKHAGPGTAASVKVARVWDRVELSISDNGRNKAGALIGVSGGNGLIGMRERALMFGGTLEAGPRPGGGWQVTASLPFGND